MMKRSRRGFTLIELMIVIAIIAILAAVLIPNFIRARGMGQLTACKSNLKNLATALELYSVDNGARYPTSMTVLTPSFIKTLPNCPTAGSDTYSGVYTSGINPDVFDIWCNGSSHVGLGIMANYPQWHSGSGLQER